MRFFDYGFFILFCINISTIVLRSQLEIASALRLNSILILKAINGILSWTFCAFALIMLMFTLVVLMMYGVSVGYHYAQKELAGFAMSSRTTTTTEEATAPDSTTSQQSQGNSEIPPLLRVITVNSTEELRQPLLDVTDPAENDDLDSSETSIVELETERSPKKWALSPRERELAKKLLSRLRRSQNTTEPIKYKYYYYVTEMPFGLPFDL